LEKAGVSEAVLFPSEGLSVGFFQQADYATGHARSLNDYLASGQVLVGVEGNEWILPYVIKQCGAEGFAYASDYPHEVDLIAAKQMIHETIERPDLTHDEKAKVLGLNAKKFLRV
jgi:predicted TIM-barrel fold metal-dependent hydrolase